VLPRQREAENGEARPGRLGASPGRCAAGAISALRATLGWAARLLLEAVVVPTVLLAVLLHVIGTTRSILVAVGWCVCAIAFRWLVDRRLPGTLLLGSAAIAARAAFALLSGDTMVASYAIAERIPDAAPA